MQERASSGLTSEIVRASPCRRQRDRLDFCDIHCYVTQPTTSNIVIMATPRSPVDGIKLKVLGFRCKLAINAAADHSGNPASSGQPVRTGKICTINATADHSGNPASSGQPVRTGKICTKTVLIVALALSALAVLGLVLGIWFGVNASSGAGANTGADSGAVVADDCPKVLGPRDHGQTKDDGKNGKNCTTSTKTDLIYSTHHETTTTTSLVPMVTSPKAPRPPPRAGKFDFLSRLDGNLMGILVPQYSALDSIF